MVFDWFRRSFNAPEAEPQPPAEPTAATPEDLSPEPAAADEDAATAEDYLAWARSAFQNLKEQTAETSESVPEAGLTPPATPVAQTPVTADQPEVAPAAAQEPVPEPIVVVPPAVSEPDELDAPVVPTAPLGSILARAEAERQARVESLKADAFEEVELPVEEEPEEELPPVPERPGLTFDENFLWSAEVLAAQGRRPEEISAEEIDWLTNLRYGLGKTRRGFVNQMRDLVGQGPMDDNAVMELESLLLQADVGVAATDLIVERLQVKLRDEALPTQQAIAYLKLLLREVLDAPLANQDTWVLAPEKGRLNIWLMAGVNGVGKTTTIGKLAHLATKSDYATLIAAADTFRAAAVQQVQVWGDRSGVDVICNPGQNTDPAAVVFDGISAAQARGTELLLVDTAGRLQNKKNLMEELAKIRRIIDRKAPEARVESLLVLDATQGQNGLRQAQVFAEAADLSGVILTKLDGTAKGGVALAIVQELGLPIRFIGAGEGIADLRPFSSFEFVQALIDG